MKKVLHVALVCALVVCACSEVPKDGLGQANAALQAGEADRTLALLNGMPSSAEVHNLRCRVYFMLERWEDAANECEQAVKLDGKSARDHLWLGRALGEKADNASFMSAYNLAKRTRSEFEQAVNLDPHDGEALSDLGEFYSSAPGVVGGGNDKAEALLPAMEKVDQALAHILRGRIAESRKDYNMAEREYKQAAATSEHPAFAWMTLASFYRKHEHWDEMEQTVELGYRAAQHDRHAGVALFNGASVLARGKRNLAFAVKMLEDYLDNYPKAEEAPAFVAYTRLAKLRSELGDKNGARQARTAALNLAHDYKPALELTF